MSTKSFVESTIAENDVVIFSKSWCPHCAKSKSLVSSLPTAGKKVKVLELDEMDDGSDIQSYLLSKTGQRSVPNVFINQQHIGGNDDFQAAHRRGEVVKLLAATA